MMTFDRHSGGLDATIRDQQLHDLTVPKAISSTKPTQAPRRRLLVLTPVTQAVNCYIA